MIKTHRCIHCSLMRCSRENETCEECISNGAFHMVHGGTFLIDSDYRNLINGQKGMSEQVLVSGGSGGTASSGITWHTILDPKGNP